MSRRLRLFILAWCVLIAPLAAQGQETVRNSLQPEAAAAVDKAVQVEMERQRIVGVAIGIVENGNVAYLRGYG